MENKKTRRSLGSPAFSYGFSAAAAAEDDQQSDNDQPDPVVVKQVAKAVIHKNKVLPIRVMSKGDSPSIS